MVSNKDRCTALSLFFSLFPHGHRRLGERLRCQCTVASTTTSFLISSSYELALISGAAESCEFSESVQLSDDELWVDDMIVSWPSFPSPPSFIFDFCLWTFKYSGELPGAIFTSHTSASEEAAPEPAMSMMLLVTLLLSLVISGSRELKPASDTRCEVVASSTAISELDVELDAALELEPLAGEIDWRMVGWKSPHNHWLELPDDCDTFTKIARFERGKKHRSNRRKEGLT